MVVVFSDLWWCNVVFVEFFAVSLSVFCFIFYFLVVLRM